MKTVRTVAIPGVSMRSRIMTFAFLVRMMMVGSPTHTGRFAVMSMMVVVVRAAGSWLRKKKRNGSGTCVYSSAGGFQ